MIVHKILPAFNSFQILSRLLQINYKKNSQAELSRIIPDDFYLNTNISGTNFLE